MDMPVRSPQGSREKARRFVLSLAACLAPASAEAHTALQGVGSFWSGVAHLLTSFDQLGFLLGLAIWTSFQSPRLDARVIGAGFAAALAGVWCGAWFDEAGRLDLAAAAAALMIAVGSAGAMRLRVNGVPLLGLASAGGLVGGASAADGAAGLSLALYSLGGAVAGASVLSYGLLAARRVEVEWGRIALRAGASWIAAIGLMVLALSFTRHTGQV
jgi:hydrogenase/urease accessory protein HupE